MEDLITSLQAAKTAAEADLTAHQAQVAQGVRYFYKSTTGTSWDQTAARTSQLQGVVDRVTAALAAAQAV